MSKTPSASRRGRKNRVENRQREQSGASAVYPGISGGRYQPLEEDVLPQLHAGVLRVLADTGLSDAPANVVQRVTAAGGRYTDDRRLTYPEELVERAIEGFQRDIVLHGQLERHDMLLSGKNVYMGSGGAAPMMLDIDSGAYRESTLQDLFDAARIVDRLEHVHFFSRSVVARDMPDDRLLDLNTAYACLKGTAKHVCVSASSGDHVKQIAEMCFTVAGSAEAFRQRPFLSLNVNHVVSPLRFHPSSCDVLEQAAKLGIPAHANIFSQVGASTPVTFAGAVIQSAAESLAGMIFSWLINPNAKLIFGPKPMITDLRTGGMSGGGGEQAAVMAAMTQLAQFYNLPNVCIAGATDSKLADAQSGFEKNLAVSLAAQAGSNLITQACGMHASLMGCALESYVIDNDMLGAILSSLRPIEVSSDSLALSSIDQVARGEGHFLGESATMARMSSDFVYPDVVDRRSWEEWEAGGRKDILETAKQRTREILASHYPEHISAEVDREIRAQFDIRLPLQPPAPGGQKRGL